MSRGETDADVSRVHGWLYLSLWVYMSPRSVCAHGAYNTHLCVLLRLHDVTGFGVRRQLAGRSAARQQQLNVDGQAQADLTGTLRRTTPACCASWRSRSGEGWASRSRSDGSTSRCTRLSRTFCCSGDLCLSSKRRAGERSECCSHPLLSTPLHRSLPHRPTPAPRLAPVRAPRWTLPQACALRIPTTPTQQLSELIHPGSLRSLALRVASPLPQSTPTFLASPTSPESISRTPTLHSNTALGVVWPFLFYVMVFGQSASL